MNFFKLKIIKILSQITELDQKELQRLIEIPPDKNLGDFSLPCFELAKTLKTSPKNIAKDLKYKIPKKEFIDKIIFQNGYLNFFINKEELAKNTLKEIFNKKNNYGTNKIGKKKTIMVEYSSPNTNKPLHLGHIRNNVLGMSISKILESQGYNVIKSCVVNDRGIHICKSMLAYIKWGNNSKPNKKPDHFVGDYYVLFSKKLQEDPSLESQAQELLKRWEAKDNEVISLWKKMNSWVYQGFNQTYKELSSEFDKIYYESKMYNQGKEIVLKGLKDSIFKEEDGAIIADLSSFNLPKRVLIRSDKTSLYITQDLYLAKLKFKKYNLYKSIYVVGNEQNLHFKQMFSILNLLGYKWYKDCYHLSHGYVSLASGRMKSREGNVIDADDIIQDLKNIERAELNQRQRLTNKELEKRSKIISLGAIKLFFLKYDPFKDFVFDEKESLALEGETGPYVQYTYARAKSIIRKSKSKTTNFNAKKLSSKEEIAIIDKLSKYPEILEEAALNYKPSLIARYLIDLSQLFNEFYQKCPVINAEKGIKQARISLVSATLQVMYNSSSLLNISLLDQM